MTSVAQKTVLTGCLAPIDKQGLEQLIVNGKANPKVIKTLKCKTVAEGKFRHANYIRNLAPYIVDEPPGLGGQDGAPNPVEYILAALGSCQEITYRLYADALGIPLNGVSVQLTGAIDLQGFFNVRQDVRPGYQTIEAEVILDSPASEQDLARLKDIVDRHCPVLDILRNPTPVQLSLRAGSLSAAAE